MYSEIIKKYIESYCKENSISDIDKGFQSYINELFYENTYDDVERAIVDGQYDKQIDLIQIDEGEVITIRIIQVKKTSGFESNTIILLKNGLDWIFNKRENELISIRNRKFYNRILEVREVLKKNSLSNIYIDVLYVTLGNTNDIVNTDEIIPEIEAIKKEYQKYENFSIKLIGSEELFYFIENRNNKIIDHTIKINSDSRNSLIKNEYKSIKSIICNVNADEFIKIFEAQQSQYLFEQNVRKYLDDKSTVNKNIIKSASGDDSEIFYALNNGITIICDKCEDKEIGSEIFLDLKNVQIINGCQTAMSLYECSKKGLLKSDTAVLLRVHETKESTLVDKIILATNNQNPINKRDLVSNNPEQIELEKYFYEIYGEKYQRKRNDFIDLRGNKVSKYKVLPNDLVGQVALACIKNMAHIALGTKGVVFDKEIKVFNINKDRIALSVFIYRKVIEFKKKGLYQNNKIEEILNFARYHISSIIYKLNDDRCSIDFNKEIKHSDFNLDMEIQIIAYLYNQNLTITQKSNLLKYFKSTDSIRLGNEIKLLVVKFKSIIDCLIDENYIIDIVNFINDEMELKYDDIEIKINDDATISMYKRFIYCDAVIEDDRNSNEYDLNDTIDVEERNFIQKCYNKFKEEPEIVDDSCMGCPATDILVGYFNKEFDIEKLRMFENI